VLNIVIKVGMLKREKERKREREREGARE